MDKSTNRWIKATWKILLLKEANAVENKSTTTLKQVGVKLRFGESAFNWVISLLK